MATLELTPEERRYLARRVLRLPDIEEPRAIRDRDGVWRWTCTECFREVYGEMGRRWEGHAEDCPSTLRHSILAKLLD